MSTQQSYESDELLAQYLEFHYGQNYFGIPNFPKTCASYCIEATGNTADKKALDLGCAVGRSAFELAPHFKQVDAIDYSHRFIECANQIKLYGYINYAVTTQGQLTQPKQCDLLSLGLTHHKNLNFYQGDATELGNQFSNYSLVFAGNLIDRLPRPKLFLDNIAPRIEADGWLILTSPYTWLSEFTPKTDWIGGYKDGDHAIETLDGLKQILEPTFKFQGQHDIPFIIRETARKFQHSIAEMTLWQKI